MAKGTPVVLLAYDDVRRSVIENAPHLLMKAVRQAVEAGAVMLDEQAREAVKRATWTERLDIVLTTRPPPCFCGEPARDGWRHTPEVCLPLRQM